MSRRWFEQLPINGWDALQLGGRLDVKEAVEEKDEEEDEGDDVKAGEEEVAEEDTDE